MRRLVDLSIRHKLPLWGALLIVISTAAVLAASLYYHYVGQRAAVASSADALAATLARSIVPALRSDDLWRAYEVVRSPFRTEQSVEGLRPALVFVVDNEMRVQIASDPRRLRVLTPLAAAGGEFEALARVIGERRLAPHVLVDMPGARHLFVVAPISPSDGALGSVVLAYSRAGLEAMFSESLQRGVLIGALTLALLLPVNWYWGRRLATPLAQIAGAMTSLKDGVPATAPSRNYPFDDEVGRLFDAFDQLVRALREKALLERGIVSAERLGAIGRLTAAIAHEINNPLAGMLTAIDTLKVRPGLDERALHTLALIERGLLQVRDTVGALLVEARQAPRALSPPDIDDVRTLLQPVAQRAQVDFTVNVDLPAAVAVPAAPVRQLLINLASNAIQAAGTGGWAHARVSGLADELRLVVENCGEPIPPARIARLFEPFVSYRDGGTGLGLWVCYQLVNQLEGWIEVHCNDGVVRFEVSLPVGQS